MTDFLTDAGRQYAETLAHGSIVARVALAGYGEWPSAYVATAVSTMNELGERNTVGRCVICGESVLSDAAAEMHDPAMYDEQLTGEERLVAQERDPNHGVCHAQCGLDRGWVAS